LRRVKIVIKQHQTTEMAKRGPKKGRFKGIKLGRGSGGVTGKGFQPGQSGNAGPKPTLALTRRVARDLRAKYDEPCPLDRPPTNLTEAQKRSWRPRSWGKVLGERSFVNAAKGNGAILHEIYDRIDGRVPAALTLQGPDGGPVEFKFDYSQLSDQELELLETVMKKTILIPPENIDAGKQESSDS